MRGKSIFKEEPLDTNFFRNLLKQRQLFRIVATYFSISFIQLVKQDLVPSRNNIFFGQSYFAASRNHYWNQEKIVFKESLFLLVGNLFSGLFHKLLLVIVFYCLVETSFSTKSLVLVNANGFSGQQKPLSFVQRFFLLVKPSLKLLEGNLYRNT